MFSKKTNLQKGVCFTVPYNIIPVPGVQPSDKTFLYNLPNAHFNESSIYLTP